MSADESDFPLSPDAPIALVIEDDADGAQVATAMLRMLGYRSRWTKDANEALYALTEGPPSIILLDICLPVMDGVNLIKVARKVRGMAAVPVVAMSAVYPAEGPVSKVLAKEGVTTFLSKPYTMNGLRAALDSARSAAMKFGPAPTASMSEGMPSITDADIAAKTTPAEPLAADEPEPVAPEPDPPTPTTPPPTPRVTPPPPARSNSVRDITPRHTRAPGRYDESDDALSFPIKHDTGEHPLPETHVPGADSLTATEILGSVTSEGANSMIIVEKATKATVTFRSLDLKIAPGNMVRMEVRHRMAVKDSMQESLIRLLGHASSCEEAGAGGWRVKARVAAARPADAWDHLVDYLTRFAGY